ncbi:MAG: hypothetical protein LBC98_10370 [Prevotellaceae bacterium]|jgi:hypothetical protein|nr:hypothetical protein [Prevotellaceae bacterium]
MIYSLEITTERNDGFLRVYHMYANDTLYDLRRLIENDLEFDDSQPGVFITEDKKGKTKRYALFDLGDGAMDAVPLESVCGEGLILYTFDLFNGRSLKIHFTGEVEREARKSYPMVAESSGEAPGQFEEKPLPAKLPMIPPEKDEGKNDEDYEHDEDEDDEMEEYDEDDLNVFDTRDEV